MRRFRAAPERHFPPQMTSNRIQSAATALLTSCALLGAVALMLAGRGGAYAFLGGSLDLTQRDFRVHNNFTGGEANNNPSPDPNFPGATGAVLAIWKGVIEWGSVLHGSGGGDDTQPGDLGSGGANFDASYQGLAPSPGGTDDNIISMLPGFGGGLIAFAELPISDGWRIRFYEAPSIWHDGPGLIPSGQFDKDMQGVAAHEYGHALGLDHSQVNGSTMRGGSGGNQIGLRSIEADDIAGVQALYGLAAAQKPHIESYHLDGSQVVILGNNFAASGNEVWFTRGSGLGDGTPLKATGISSRAGGTLLRAVIPAAAGAGDILVKIPGAAHGDLSGAFPFDPVLGYCPPIVSHGAGKTTSMGTTPTLTAYGTPSVFYSSASTGFGLTALGGLPNAPGILFYGASAAARPFMGGTLYSNGPLVRDTSFTFGFFGDLSIALGVDPATIGTTRIWQLWFRDTGDAFGVGLSNGVEVTYCL
ncbi:MAG TPA: matrixin family metalloprotease [Planctomycetes bacterium]|nr:matrixin family metalloprotease [Planctomycetota bacterium]HIL52213.1 matrixin family metalloprotease [Planctomycetota bacterium]